MELTAGRLYRSAIAKHWPFYIFGVAAVFLTNATEVLAPKFIQWTLDLLATKTAVSAVPEIFRAGTTGGTLRLLLIGLVLNVMLGWVFRILWRQFLARRTHESGRDLKVGLWQVLRHQPIRTFHKYTLGDIMNRATGDWNASRFIHGFTMVLTADMVFISVLGISCMFWIDVELSLYCLAIFPFLPRFIVRLAKKEHDLHIWAQERLSDLSDLISQALGTIRLQRATQTDVVWRKKLEYQADDYAKRRFEVVKTGWKIFPLGALPTLIAYGILLFLGVNKIMAGELSAGEFVALQSYVLILQGPLFEMGDCIAEWQRGFASMKRLAEIFNLQRVADRYIARKVEPVWPASGKALIEAEGIRFQYEEETELISDSELKIRVGENIGLTGPIGTGKTTFLSLISGLEEGVQGRLLLAGNEVDLIDRKWLADNVAMVPQRSFLFAGTVRHNLLLDMEASDRELWDILELVCLADDVRGFPEGINTWVGEWGINLSGGQKQRLALARALLRDRKLILLDDCLSAVDAVTEEHILKNMKNSLTDATVVWVAHRRSTLKLCDRIFAIEDFKLQEVSP